MMPAPSCVAAPSPHLTALRILARRDDNEVLIVCGCERPLVSGERLAFVAWHPSRPAAEAALQIYRERLRSAGAWCRERESGGDGWHPFPAALLGHLVGQAQREASDASDGPGAPERPRRWSGERIARLGFLAGLGYTAKKIAEDPLIATTPGNVHRQAHRFGIALSGAAAGRIDVRLPLAVLTVYGRAAARSQLTCEAFLRRLLIAAAANPEIVPGEGMPQLNRPALTAV